MTYMNTLPRHGLGIDKELLKQAKEDAKQQAIAAAKAQIIAKQKGKMDGLHSKSTGETRYNPPAGPEQAAYNEQWALAAGRPVPAAAPLTPAAEEGPPMALIAGGLLAAAAGIWYWKKRRG